VPERDFAFTVLANCTSGYRLTTDLFADDWALQRFAGLHNPPAVPTRVSPARLAEYEGIYVARSLDDAGEWMETTYTMRASDGALQATREAGGQRVDVRWEFYRGEYVLAAGSEYGPPGSARSNFVRGPDGRVAWFLNAGRLYAHQS
jgi:hypothetical protein